jgi:FlaA1/EpsC-like NDP-sugar epimerase
MRKKFETEDERYNLENQLQKYIIHLIEGSINNNFDVRYDRCYEYDMHEIAVLSHKRLVLYGAGKKGKEIYNLFSSIEPKCIVAVVDKCPEKAVVDSVKVKPVSELSNIDFDYVVITVANEQIVDEIKIELCRNIEPEKIVWLKSKERIWYRKITFK